MHLKEINIEWTLQKSNKTIALTQETDFNVPSSQPI